MSLAAPIRVDAHQHFWSLARGDYRWLTPDLAPLYHDFGPADLAPKLRAAGIACSVVVQAADTPAETDFLLGIAARADFVAGVVGWADLEQRQAPDVLARLAAQRKLVGVRPMIQDIADDAWMLRESLTPAFDALVQLDLCFDALVLPRHLGHLCELVERHPGLRVVIDHAAKPDLAAGTGWSGFREWYAHLARLALDPDVWCKLSGLVTEAGPQWRTDDLRRCVDALLALFGPGRLVWGSDWPVVDLAGGYERWWSATRELLEPLAEHERDLVLGMNALRLYGLEVEAAAPRVQDSRHS